MELYINSYYLYIGTISLSVFFVWIAELIPRKSGFDIKVSSFFWILSFLVLWFVMGFRFEIGPDYFSYQLMFEKVSSLGFFGYYNAGFWNEPGYILLLYLVSLVWGNFFGVFVCTSFIGLYLLYRAFAFESSRIHPAWCVFVFSTTQYFYYFGIDRLFLAVSMVTYGLRFIHLGKKNKFLMTVVVAACFHLSALFMAFLPFIYEKLKAKVDFEKRTVHNLVFSFKLKRYFFWVCMTPFIFYGISYLIPYLPAKYQGYGISDDNQINIYSILLKVPIATLVLFTLRQSLSFYPGSFLYSIMYITSLFIQTFGSIAGLGRLGWYFWISLCFVFPVIVKSYNFDKVRKFVFILFIIVYCVGYMFHAYLDIDSSRASLMFPYRNLFFKFGI
jgi:hypothetical protein